MAHGDYGNFNSQLAKVAADNRWRQSQSCIITDRTLVEKANYALSNNNNNNNNNEKFDINDPTAKLTLMSSGSSSNSAASDCSDDFRGNRPSELRRLQLLLGRCYLQLYRDWSTSHLMLVCHMAVGVLLGLFYGDSGINAEKTYNNVGLLMIGVIYLWYTAMMPSVLKCKLTG